MVLSVQLSMQCQVSWERERFSADITHYRLMFIDEMELELCSAGQFHLTQLADLLLDVEMINVPFEAKLR